MLFSLVLLEFCLNAFKSIWVYCQQNSESRSFVDLLAILFSCGELFLRERARKKKEEEERLAEREKEKVLLHSFL